MYVKSSTKNMRTLIVFNDGGLVRFCSKSGDVDVLKDSEYSNNFKNECSNISVEEKMVMIISKCVRWELV